MNKRHAWGQLGNPANWASPYPGKETPLSLFCKSLSSTESDLQLPLCAHLQVLPWGMGARHGAASLWGQSRPRSAGNGVCGWSDRLNYQPCQSKWTRNLEWGFGLGPFFLSPKRTLGAGGCLLIFPLAFPLVAKRLSRGLARRKKRRYEAYKEGHSVGYRALLTQDLREFLEEQTPFSRWPSSLWSPRVLVPQKLCALVPLTS